MEKKKISSTTKIFIGLILGAIVGMIMYYLIPDNKIKNDIIINGAFYIIGQGFIRAMQMLVVPLVFFSIMDGVRSMGDTKTLGKVGVKIVVFYLFTTALAIAIALTFASITKPGIGMNLVVGDNKFEANTEKVSIADTFINMIPSNPISALANGDMIQIIIFAAICGLIVANIEEKTETIGNIVSEMNEIMMNMTLGVMKFAPFGVFCLLARTFSTLGWDVILSMLSYILTVVGGLGLQLVLVYMLVLAVFMQINPFNFLKKYLPVMEFAFSTASSNATVPINITTLEKMGVDKKISSFTIPLGATINMDGTAIMQGVAVVFIANAYGIELSFSDFMMVIFTATLASVGTAGVPSVGLITLTMVLTSVGLPTEGIAMIMGVDRILDMSRTAINVTGDAVGTIVVSKMEKYIDIDKFKSKI